MTSQSEQPALIVIGGFAGSGKSTLARRLSADLYIPRLSSDDIGQTMRTSPFMTERDSNTVAVAYDVVFDLCADFLRSGVSTILDINMAWAFQWDKVDAIRLGLPHVRWFPFILRCSWDVCMSRIEKRYASQPGAAHPHLYKTQPHILNAWTFLERLERSDVHLLDASFHEDIVYENLMQVVSASRPG